MGTATAHGGLVGRDGQLTVLQDAMSAAAERAAVVLISGEAGIGKSQLVETFADANRGMQLVLVGGCIRVSGEPILYAPIAEVLRQIRRDTGVPSTLSGHAIEEIDALLQLREVSPPRTRSELFERMLRLFELVRPPNTVLVLVLEDVHWADDDTIDMIGFLARNLAAGSLLVVTYRGEEVEPASALRTLVRRLRSDSRVRYLELPRLSRAELTQLATARLGREPSPAEIERLSTRSEGNPFFAEELLAAGEYGGLPESLQDVLLSRAHRLSGDAERVVRVAAVIGRPVDHETLAAAVGLDERRLFVALKESVASGLLSVDRKQDYVFRHVLTQEAVLATLLPGERRGLHRAVADALASQPDLATSPSRAVEWATHLSVGGAPRDEAAAASLDAARLATQIYAHADAWRLYQRSVELTRVDGSDTIRAGLLAEAAEAARRAGKVDEAVDLGDEARRLETAPDKRAMIMEALGRAWWEKDDLKEAGRWFDQAASQIAECPPSELTARIVASQARLDYACDRVHAAAEHARWAVELAERVHAPAEEARARSILGSCLVLLGDITAGLDLVRQGQEMTREWGDLDDRQLADTRYAYALSLAGRGREGSDVLLSTLATVRRYGAADLLTNNVLTHLRHDGRWTEADSLAAELLAEDPPARQARNIDLCRAELDIRRGREAAARSHLTSAWKGVAPSQEPATTSDLYLAEAELALLLDDFDGASAAIRAVAPAVEASEVDRVRVRVAQRSLFVLADLALHQRPAEAASAPDETPSPDYLRSQLDECVARSPSAEVAAYAHTGEAEYARGRRASDSGLWQQAAQSWEKLGRPRGVAYCTMRLAEAELLAGRATAAAKPLRRAHEGASQLGAEPIRRTAEELAQRLLTEREGDVLRELTLGLSDREIANKLFVSDRTVRVHISNVLAKLSAHSRAEAAAVATQLHLLDEEGERHQPAG